MLDGFWGYDTKSCTTAKKIANKREGFTESYAIRLQNVQIENTEALRIIRSRDHKGAFHYCDPPYFNSDFGHYEGYSKSDFGDLLRTLQSIDGKFMMSSYPSDILGDYTKENGWFAMKVEQTVSVANGTGGTGKKKVEVITANYDLNNPREELTLF